MGTQFLLFLASVPRPPGIAAPTLTTIPAGCPSGRERPSPWRRARPGRVMEKGNRWSLTTNSVVLVTDRTPVRLGRARQGFEGRETRRQISQPRACRSLLWPPCEMSRMRIGKSRRHCHCAANGRTMRALAPSCAAWALSTARARGPGRGRRTEEPPTKQADPGAR
jgi:hypothetical protein